MLKNPAILSLRFGEDLSDEIRDALWLSSGEAATKSKNPAILSRLLEDEVLGEDAPDDLFGDESADERADETLGVFVNFGSGKSGF